MSANPLFVGLSHTNSEKISTKATTLANAVGLVLLALGKQTPHMNSATGEAMSEISDKKDDKSRKLNIFDSWVIRIGHFIAGFYLIAVLITVYEVVMRYLFKSPTQWVFETSVLLVGTAMLYGGAYCLSNDGHIRVTIIIDMLPKKIRQFIDSIVYLLTLLFILSLCYAAFFMTKKAFFTPRGEFHMETSGSAFDSAMPAAIKFFLLLVVVLMAVQATMQFLSSLVNLFSKSNHD